jgi:hypothetical protein
MITSEGIGGKIILQQHEESNADISGLVDEADDPVEHVASPNPEG